MKAPDQTLHSQKTRKTACQNSGFNVFKMVQGVARATAERGGTARALWACSETAGDIITDMNVRAARALASRGCGCEGIYALPASMLPLRLLSSEKR
jgi:hypothetical protein